MQAEVAWVQNSDWLSVESGRRVVEAAEGASMTVLGLHRLMQVQALPAPAAASFSAMASPSSWGK